MYKAKLFFIFCLLLALFSCKEKKEKAEADSLTDLKDYYQKEIPFDGWKAEIDSVVSFTYPAEMVDGEIKEGSFKSKNMKVFNKDGYIVSSSTAEYEYSELFSAAQTTLARDENNLQSYSISNFISTTGEGYTLQYSLNSRAQNVEVWELTRKLPGRDVERVGEIREYTKNGVKIFVQVENRDSITLVLESRFGDGKLQENLFYEDEVIRSKTELSYNENDFLSSVLVKDLKEISKTDKVKRFEYKYDSVGNPLEVLVFEDEALTEVLENKIYYRKNE